MSPAGVGSMRMRSSNGCGGNGGGSAIRRGLARLRRDRTGNTLAMMAIALIPLSAMAGSGLDMARLYVVKVRLQQACDAGALAGRKFMAEDGANSLDGAAAAQAQAFFRNNFPVDWMQTKAVSFTPRKTNDSQVAGTATATVPMTVMKMFKAPDVTLNVACEARYDVPDIDVMFVLDTTGSMAYAATDTSLSGQSVRSYTRADGTTGYYVEEKGNARIKALRTAVLDFWDEVNGSVDPDTNVRYGIVPYSSAVNVGYDLPAGSLVQQWTYETRRNIGDADAGNAVVDYPLVDQRTCEGYAGRNPRGGYTGSEKNERAARVTVTWNGSAGNRRCTRSTQPLRPLWRFAPQLVDVTQYALGQTVPDPSKVTGATSRWQGCIEERQTVAATTFSQGSLPFDLHPDLPAQTDDTRWRPMWPEQIYYRGSPATFDSVGAGENLGGPDYVPSGFATCPKRVKRLGVMTRADLAAYLNTPEFRPLGGTYHDVGMIWGTRLISPTGPFERDTAAWPDRTAPRRFIIFMTDGEMAPSADIYGQYAHERTSQRVTAGDLGSLTARHNARFLAECDAARARNLSVFVVAFGSRLTNELRTCATTPAQAFAASDDATLRAQFRSIARQVAMLRVSK